jgi:adenylylsulfate kinase-like enzyme
MTGIDDPYEPPLAPQLTLAASEFPPERLADQVIAYLESAGLLAIRADDSR